MHQHEVIDTYYAPRNTIDYEKEINYLMTNEKSFFFVAEEDKTLVGFITGTERDFDDRNEPFLYISDIYVLEAFRKKSIGRQLLEVVYTEAKKKGLRRFELQVDLRNKDAVKFWNKNNFQSFMFRMKKDL